MNAMVESAYGGDDDEDTESFDEKNSGPRILVVKDDPIVRELNAEVLTRSGDLVDTAEDGDAGLKAVSEQASGYDLIITDNLMPKVTLAAVQGVPGTAPHVC